MEMSYYISLKFVRKLLHIFEVPKSYNVQLNNQWTRTIYAAARDMPMPHGSDKSPEKNFTEIHHSLCMPHGSDKSWQPIKNLGIVKKLNHLFKM